nr:TIM barrel protein [Marinicella sp. W31]MDC2877084.1 TIM barrel protein [Marinicella sp. W31]
MALCGPPRHLYRPDRAGRCRRFRSFEFWHWSNKDIDAIARTASSCNIAVAGLVAEPLIAITNPANRSVWLEGLKQSLAVARKLNAPVLIAQAGDDLPEMTRPEQKAALIETLAQAAGILSGSGVTLGLEPLNTKVDHPGYYLHSTREGFEVIDAVGRKEIGMVYDIYHSFVMGEEIDAALAENVEKIVHVHVADAPGRNDPGSGQIDLAARLQRLKLAGYGGRIGLEYKPLKPESAPVATVREMLSEALRDRG